jgi:hypothetical protein
MKLCILVSALCLLTSVAAGDDVGVDTIVSPTGTIDSGVLVVPKCAVHAYTGPGPVDVHFVIPEAGYHDSLTLPPLPPGLVDSATFAPWVPNARDSMTALVWLHCDGDTNPSNDTCRVRFFVRVFDIVLALIVPVDTVDSGVPILPSAMLWNYGNTSFWGYLKFRVDTTYYSRSADINLSPGGSTAVFAADSWYPLPGRPVLACSLFVLPADTCVAAKSHEFWVPGSGIDEAMGDECRAVNSGSTILRASGIQRLASEVLFDAMGRRVMNPRSGILFVRERSAVGGKPSAVAVRKVIITE